MPRGLDVSLPEELQPAVLEPSMIVSWLAREEGRDMEEDLNEEEKKYMISKASTLRQKPKLLIYSLYCIVFPLT